MSDYTRSTPKDIAGRKWIIAQTWSRLLFAHWPVSAQAVRDLVPEPLEIDTFDGQAWLGIVALRMSGIRMRFLPFLPYPFPFNQLNVRTYVRDGDKPSIYIFSMDISDPLFVIGSKLTYRLPSYNADISLTAHERRISFSSKRETARTAPAVFNCEYEPVSPPYISEPDTLEHWLTERYRMYCQQPHHNAATLISGDVHHMPWRLQRANAMVGSNTMAEALNIPLPAAAPLVHYAEGVRVHLDPIRRITIEQRQS